MAATLRDASAALWLHPHIGFIDKCRQLYHTVAVSRSVIVVGDALAGKTCVRNVVATTVDSALARAERAIEAISIVNSGGGGPAGGANSSSGTAAAAAGAAARAAGGASSGGGHSSSSSGGGGLRRLVVKVVHPMAHSLGHLLGKLCSTAADVLVIFLAGAVALAPCIYYRPLPSQTAPPHTCRRVCRPCCRGCCGRLRRCRRPV